MYIEDGLAPSREGINSHIEQEERCKHIAKAKEQYLRAKQSGYSAYCELNYGTVDIYDLGDKRSTLISLDSNGKDLPYVDLTVKLFDGAFYKSLSQVDPIAEKLLRKESDEETCPRYLNNDRRVTTIDDPKLWLSLKEDLTVGVYAGKELMSWCIAKIKKH